jgi:diaminopimelate decarboxylase
MTLHSSTITIMISLREMITETMTKNLSINKLKPLSFSRNDKQEILMNGFKLKDLLNQYGSPLYLLCEDTIRARANQYKDSFKEFYGEDYEIVYASKALNCQAICKLMDQESISLDVVSIGELHTAMSVKFPAEKIIFHGNNKSKEEIQACLDKGVRIILDNFNDLRLIDELNIEKKDVEIIIRVTPGIECHTHEYIKTGKIDSKFGFNLEDVLLLVGKLKVEYSYIKILGLHSHIGSQIFEMEPQKDAALVLLNKYKEIKDQHGLEMSHLNIGGGLGIKYLESDDPPEIADLVKSSATAVINACKDLGLKKPILMMEPGRSMVAPAGITAYRVGNIKDIPNLRKYVCVDGGMADNVRPIMYQAQYHAELDAKDPNKDLETVTIAGKYCESGDVLIKDIKMSKAQTDDLLVVFSTGAYNYSMASNYNRATRPAMVLVNKNGHNLIVRRESLDDLLSHDLVPDYLN